MFPYLIGNDFARDVAKAHRHVPTPRQHSVTTTRASRESTFQRHRRAWAAAMATVAITVAAVGVAAADDGQAMDAGNHYGSRF